MRARKQPAAAAAEAEADVAEPEEDPVAAVFEDFGNTIVAELERRKAEESPPEPEPEPEPQVRSEAAAFHQFSSIDAFPEILTRKHLTCCLNRTEPPWLPHPR